MSVLDEIIAKKAEHVAAMKAARPLADVEATANAQPVALDFCNALTEATQDRRFGLICEVKKASPSKGVIRADFDPPAHAKAYQAGGAACLSVLTDEPYFQGADAYLQSVRQVVDIPLLRKDFMIDPYQVAEARALGADCILLIIAALETSQAQELEAAALDHGMAVLAEVHAVDELDMALALKTPLVGVNNRNLKTLEVDTATTPEVARLVPEGYQIVAESGLSNHDDLVALKDQGISRFLIGEALMRQNDIEAATREMLGGSAHAG